MRITGGTLRGRTIEMPQSSMAIRPAMDKMRESLFNILAPYLTGKSFLDLFSGSGTIALEAVSHGASDVTLCEMDRAKANVIFKNVKMAEEVGVKVKCHFMPVERFLLRAKQSWDFIFLDPPFPYKYRLQLLQTISEKNLLNEGGKVLIHFPKEDMLPETIGNLKRTDIREYGRSTVFFYEKNYDMTLDKAQ